MTDHKTTGEGPLDNIVLSARSRLRVTAKIAISISLLSALVLVFILQFLLIDQSEKNYLETIVSLSQSQQQLTIAMAVGGALVITAAGLLTWLFTLYFSHRIAGPVYRFTRNLELEIEKGPVPTVAIRKEDSLQAVSRKLSDAVNRLSQYYDGQLEIVDKLDQALNGQGLSDPQSYDLLVDRLEKAVGAKK